MVEMFHCKETGSDPEKSRNAGCTPIKNWNKPFGWVFLSKVPPQKIPKKSGNFFPSAWRDFLDLSIFLPDFGVPLTHSVGLEKSLQKIGCPRIFVQRFFWGGRTSDLLKKNYTYSPFLRWEYQKFLTNAYLTVQKYPVILRIPGFWTDSPHLDSENTPSLPPNRFPNRFPSNLVASDFFPSSIPLGPGCGVGWFVETAGFWNGKFICLKGKNVTIIR